MVAVPDRLPRVYEWMRVHPERELAVHHENPDLFPLCSSRGVIVSVTGPSTVVADERDVSCTRLPNGILLQEVWRSAALDVARWIAHAALGLKDGMPAVSFQTGAAKPYWTDGHAAGLALEAVPTRSGPRTMCIAHATRCRHVFHKWDLFPNGQLFCAET